MDRETNGDTAGRITAFKCQGCGGDVIAQNLATSGTYGIILLAEGFKTICGALFLFPQQLNTSWVNNPSSAYAGAPRLDPQQVMK